MEAYTLHPDVDRELEIKYGVGSFNGGVFRWIVNSLGERLNNKFDVVDTKRYVGFKRKSNLFAWVDMQQHAMVFAVRKRFFDRLPDVSLKATQHAAWGGPNVELVGFDVTNKDQEVVWLLESMYRFAGHTDKRR